MLEAEPKEVEPRSLGYHAAIVTRVAIVTKDWQVDPAVVRGETRAPDHDIGIHCTALTKWLPITHFGEPADASDTRSHDIRWSDADERIRCASTSFHAPTDHGVRIEPGEDRPDPVVQVATEESSVQVAGLVTRQPHSPGLGQLHRDLSA